MMKDEESIPYQPKAIHKPMESIESSYGAFADVSMSRKGDCENLFETPGNLKYQHPLNNEIVMSMFPGK